MVTIARKLSNICLKIVGVGKRGSGATILLDIERNRYLFNCEENVDRLFVEGNIPNTVDTLKGVFLTCPIWERFVSVPNYGMAPDTQGMSTGKPNCFRVYTAKPNIVRDTLKLFRNVEESWEVVDVISPEAAVYKDSNITIRPIIISKDTGDTGKDTGDTGDTGNSLDTAVGYYGEIRDNPPDLIFNKLVELGIEKNSKLLKQLRMGNSIVTPDGRTVNRVDCIGSPTPGATFVILECPNIGFIESIVANRELKSLQETQERVLKVVVHILPQCVLASDTYIKWIRGFNKGTEHVIVLTDHKPNIPIYGYKMRCILNLVSPTFYPIRRHPGRGELPWLPDGCENMHIAEDNCLFYLNRNKKQQDMPNFNVARLPTQREVMQECYTEIQDCFEFHKTQVFERQLTAGVFVNTSQNNNNQLQKVTPLEHFESFINNNNNNNDLTPRLGDPLIVFLGTASAGSTYYRNCTSILITDASKNSYILDCGIGTYMQLWDRFRDRTDSILSHLKFIFISHRHIDHHSGIARLLQERALLTREELLVFAPGIIRDKLMFYSDNVQDLGIEVIELSELMKGVKPEIAAKLSLKGLRTVRVSHCYDSYGISMVHREGWKVVYSGDTRPVPELAKIGANADLLIHDATFGRGFERHAVHKRHSTSSEAIQLGRDMGAKYTVLTHFSHRYNKLPHYEASFVSGNVVVAFDMLSFLLSQIPMVIAAQATMKDFVPKYIREACKMTIGDYQWNSIDSWESDCLEE